MAPAEHQFARELMAQIGRAQQQGRPHVEVNAGELHRLLGGYPAPDGRHAMPVCCEVMREKYVEGHDTIIHKPPKGRGASLTIRYRLPRPDASAAKRGSWPENPLPPAIGSDAAED